MDLHQDQTWDGYDQAAYLDQKLKAVQKLIPKDVKTILDAGCGNGAITNILDKAYDIMGIDISDAALKHVTAPKMIASITQLPFENASFDLCMCHEVLEHLPTDELNDAIRELKRCSAKYIMISVPYAENLGEHYAKCADCDCEFHVYGHLKSYDEKLLDAMLKPEYQSSKILIMGPIQKRSPVWLSSFKQKHLRQWFHPNFHLTCPKCGGSNFIHKSNLLTKMANSLNKLISIRKPYWLLALYHQQNSDLH